MAKKTAMMNEAESQISITEKSIHAANKVANIHLDRIACNPDHYLVPAWERIAKEWGEISRAREQVLIYWEGVLSSEKEKA